MTAVGRISRNDSPLRHDYSEQHQPSCCLMSSRLSGEGASNRPGRCSVLLIHYCFAGLVMVNAEVV